ncbi:unnamed protein product [Parnassius apollo]|uniref:(apollo) hypothetical protein n=1 Tax=Parnassius apollo TaxID=110799 RepID=A0A8S3W9L6_PARAO|nr:unnamed protein product [Parnassius apollo]
MGSFGPHEDWLFYRASQYARDRSIPRVSTACAAANDLTHYMGSFGPHEDWLFYRASQYARDRSIPRVSTACAAANDLTHYMGSFGPHEDWLFYRASQYARDRSIPRVSTACAAANDLTHYMGSFGPHEDWLFYRASQYARDRSIPRVSTACAAANDLAHYMGSFGPHEDWFFYRASQYARDRSILRVSTACAAANDLTHYMGSFGPHEDWLFYRASQYARDRSIPRYARDRSIPRVSTACAAANDLTHYMGSFGPHEDWLFYRASQYARDRSIPRVSTACAAANDLTHYMGSFGPHEDWLFYRASQYARDRSIPRVSTACAAANDLTHYMGSFGPHEDWLFYRASQYARDRSIPRVSTACAAANDLTHYMGSFGPHEDWLFYRASQYARDRSILRVSTACAAANDLTHYMGSFGPHEDWLFYRASQYARDRSIPRIYVSVNSGARIGVAEEVKSEFNVAWIDAERPERGFKYLYLTPEAYSRLGPLGSVKTELIDDEGESRYKITDIIGKEDGLGVECLRDAGLIAGETAQAYEDIVTISIVTCRAIGIGSYVVRLGHRVVQVESSYIILTGYAALNKVLGRAVYASNNQLGGVQIMHNNGVSHAVAPTDLEAVRTALRWLSYVPKDKFSMVPIMRCVDPIDRPVEWVPPKAAHDPRLMLTGDSQRPGFFDAGSFDEIMKPWAQTVITGRARLGGIPVGVIAVETRTVEITLPADPANLDSESKTLQQAGQVWFPDSAYKTSQAINDFSRENLPIIIFANWRGFSGGQKDMYEQILKFGAEIVRALRGATAPVLVYVPPGAELRGGAWAVVDPSVNAQRMEMYADPDARGGVLEAEGIVEVKFKQRDILKTMHRLDPELLRLSARISEIKDQIKEISKGFDRRGSIDDVLVRTDAGNQAESRVRELETELIAAEKTVKAREKELSPIYHEIAVQFAELHDTAERMLEKGCIFDIIPWRDSRRLLHWRLLRLLRQNAQERRVQAAGRPAAHMDQGAAAATLRRWFTEDRGETQSHQWENDNEAVCRWLESQAGDENSVLERNLRAIKQDAVLQACNNLVMELTPSQRAEFVRKLTALEMEQ